MLLEQETGINPYKFGFIGASDTHNAASSVEEDNYVSKVALMDGRGAYRGSVPLTAEQQKIVTEAGRLTVVETPQGSYAKGNEYPGLHLRCLSSQRNLRYLGSADSAEVFRWFRSEC